MNNKDENISAFPPPPNFYKLYHPRNPNPPRPPPPFEDNEDYRFLGGLFKSKLPDSFSLLRESNQRELFRSTQNKGGDEDEDLDDDEENKDNNRAGTRRKRRRKKKKRKSHMEDEDESEEEEEEEISHEIGHKISAEKAVHDLKSMNISLLNNFRELLRILITKPLSELTETRKSTTFQNFADGKVSSSDPSLLIHQQPAYEIKIKQIRLIITNMYYLLNSLRHIQSKMEIRNILQSQINRKKEEREKLSKIITSVKNKLIQKKKHIITGNSNHQQSKHSINFDFSSDDNVDHIMLKARKRKRNETQRFIGITSENYKNGQRMIDEDFKNDDDDDDDISEQEQEEQKNEQYINKKKKMMMNIIKIPDEIEDLF